MESPHKNYETLKSLRTKIAKLMLDMKVDSYTCVLKIVGKEKLYTSNLSKISLEENETTSGVFQIFYNKKRYILKVTNFDDLQEQIQQIPASTSLMAPSEYYEEKSLYHTSIDYRANNFILPIEKLSTMMDTLFEIVKSYQLIDETMILINSFCDHLIFNSAGYENYRYTSAAFFDACLLSSDNDSKYTSYYGTPLSVNTDYKLCIQNMAEDMQKFKEKTIIPIGKYPVIFHREVAASLVDMIISALEGSAIWDKQSFLINKLGEQIFANNINIIEDPQMKDSIYNSPADMEGVAIEKKHIIENGFIKTLLLNREYGTKLNSPSTGNGWDFSIGYTNIFLQPEDHSLKDLIKIMHTGILVMQTIGDGFHVYNGEISICIKGFYYEDNIFKGTVTGTLSGNLVDIMQEVSIGNDLFFKYSLSSPSILVAPMTFAN